MGRVGSLRSRLDFKQINEQEWEEESKCQELRKAWLRDFPKVFKEDLGKEDRIDMEPVVVDLIPDHEKIKDEYRGACLPTESCGKRATEDVRRGVAGGNHWIHRTCVMWVFCGEEHKTGGAIEGPPGGGLQGH